jgi:hypothetical protein
VTPTAEHLVSTSSDELDALFSDSLPGETPSGRGDGVVILAPGSFVARPFAKLAHLALWQGKVFDADRRGLRNLITPLRLKAIRAEVYPDRSWFDDKDCIVLDYSKTSKVAHWIRDEIREVAPNVYLGLVFWGRRRLLKFALVFPSPGAGSG